MFKKKLGFYLLIAIILVLVVAVPVFANGKDPVGTRINFFEADEFTVSGPFHVLHGYYFANNELTGRGRTEFSLEIDGVAQDGRFISFKDDDGVKYHMRLFNYPDGLPAGEYLFTGTWDEPCNFYDLCDKKNALVDPPYTMEVTVTVE